MNKLSEMFKKQSEISKNGIPNPGMPMSNSFQGGLWKWNARQSEIFNSIESTFENGVYRSR